MLAVLMLHSIIVAVLKPTTFFCTYFLFQTTNEIMPSALINTSYADHPATAGFTANQRQVGLHHF